MSAYGAISRPSTVSTTPLLATKWTLPRKEGQDPHVIPGHVTVHHFTPVIQDHPDLVDVLYEEFADEIDRGLTYPQEVLPAGTRLSKADFQAYFFSGDVFVGIAMKRNVPDPAFTNVVSVEGNWTEILDSTYDLNTARAGRPWAECVAGFYYVKPNYPGRSSHICNGGFVVPYSQRGKGYSWPLALSFVFYAPKLGYEASVFNLVYTNNAASVRLWQTLNFTQAGLIPRAGRLKRKDGEGEEYVDAFVFYKSFR